MGGPFFIICSRMVVGCAGGRLPPLRLCHGVPKKAFAFLGRGDITECARGGFC